jgi:hypothetical protein
LLIGERSALRIISRFKQGDDAIVPSGRPPNAANNILAFAPNLFAAAPTHADGPSTRGAPAYVVHPTDGPEPEGSPPETGWASLDRLLEIA